MANCVEEQCYNYKPTIAMIAVQCIYAAMALFAKAAFAQGMSPNVFVVYRQAIASLVLVPATIIFSSRGCMAQVSIGWTGFSLVFVASLVGPTLYQYFFYQGLHLATAQVATAMLNIVPAITFVMAASIGLEEVRLTSFRSMVKVFGTFIYVGGAISMGYFKGPKVLNVEVTPLTSIVNSVGKQWILGFVFLVGCSCCCSVWLILQVPICNKYLDPLSLSAWMSVLSTCQSAVLALFVVPDLRAWRITSNLELISCLFVGIFGSGVTFYLQSWTISINGPFFAAMFTPLCTVITTTVSISLLHDDLYVGSLVGAIAVILGLYVVLWGKAKDSNSKTKPCPEEDSGIQTGHRRPQCKKYEGTLVGYNLAEF